MQKVTPEKFFPIIILVIGVLMVFLTPFNAGFDEDAHLARAWEMSSGELMPNRLLGSSPYYPGVFLEISYRQWRNPGAITPDIWREQLKRHIDWDNMAAYPTRSVYFPALYLLPAFTTGIMGRVMDLPAGWIIYVARLSYLLSYALLVYLALRWLPFGKWIMGFFACTPMALVLASVITPDALNNGLSFLFIAWVLKLSVSDPEKPFTRSEWWISLALVMTVAMLKANSIPLLFLLFIIPKSKFGSVKNRWLAAGAVLVVVAVIYVGWNVLVTWDSLNASADNPAGLNRSLKDLLFNPLEFVGGVIYTVKRFLPEYYTQWVGTTGYNYWPFPTIVYWLFPVALILAMMTDSTHQSLTRRSRLVLLGVCFMTFLATFVIFYLYSFVPPVIWGVGGRYFVAISPVLMIAFLPNRPLRPALAGWLRALLIAIVVIVTAGLGIAYHVPCGSTFYTAGVCLQPKYKNWEPSVQVPLSVAATTRVEQTLTPLCTDIHQLRFWVNQNSLQGEVKTCLTSLDGNQEQCTAVPASTFTEPGWNSIEIPTFTAQTKAGYRLSLTAQGTGLLTLSAFPISEYPGHEFRINDRLQPGTLVFQYACPGQLQALLSTK
jgi:uncharacterized membrane protein